MANVNNRLTRSQMDAALKALYDQVPEIPDCEGRCWISCGSIDMSDRERQRIRQAGYEITPIEEARARVETYYCEALTQDNRCAVYELRPLVCRLWGTSESLKCPYGCKPAGGWIPDDDVIRLLIEAARIGGQEIMLPDSPEVSQAITSEWFREVMRTKMKGGAASERLRISNNIPAAFRKKSER